MTGKSLIDNILMGLLLLSGVFSLGVFIYTQIVFERPPIHDEKEFELLKAEAAAGKYREMFNLDEMTVNVHGNRGRLRFLNVNIHILPFRNHQVEVLEKNKTQIKDSIIDIAGRMTPNELNEVTGKILLKSRIKDSIRQITVKPFVKDVIFSKFVIQ